ncbi:hypothetical protein FNF29_06122 [Cafeteria roenbergensis]|uniref:PhoD-like phosphatase metallophosphatase domain-containing protein n=1 Tax=Cafeteria roenbergensis TaxID=33653 RepID=A0A5A8C8N0_CAFRO|nr:hypothetical protein FNF29_06122 [Cafeteria roenbergensis]|eukprot:KAA0149235.1 hypothetical protein FNF29_06122 [Cafeteria roenbergensis]
MGRRILLAVAVAWMAASALGQQGSRLPVADWRRGLLVMGAVTRTSARFIAEAASTAPDGAEYDLTVVELDASKEDTSGLDGTLEQLPGAVVLRTSGVRLAHRPRAIELQQLSPDSWYQACVSSMGCVVFKTFPGETKQPAPRTCRGGLACGQHSTFFVSCDRWVEDGDDDMWATFIGKEQLGPGSIRSVNRTAAAPQDTPALAFVHLGDQVYMDGVVAAALASTESLPLDALVERFRAFYRASWGRPAMRQVLRRGAHFFLADDHDFFNNARADHRSLAHEIAGEHDARLFIRHTVSGNVHFNDIALAGYIAFAEYQLQTQRDISGLDETQPRTLYVTVGSTPASTPASIPEADAGAAPEALSTAEADSVFNSSLLDAEIFRHVTDTYNLTGTGEAAAEFTMAPETALAPSETSHSFQLGTTAYLLMDSRIPRLFASDPNGDEHPILSNATLLAVLRELRAFEQDSAVSEVVVAASIPLVWMDEVFAQLANFWEKERYTAHPVEQAGFVALLELLAASSKTHLLVGGDVHVQAQSWACRSSSVLMDTPVYAKAAALLAGVLREAGHNSAAAAVAASATNPDAVLAAVAGVMAGHPVRPRRDACLTQVVTSGVTVGSSTRGEHIVALYNGALRWVNHIRVGPWAGRLSDIAMVNNYLRIDSGDAATEAAVRSETSLWWSPASPDSAAPARWEKSELYSPLSCTALRSGPEGAAVAWIGAANASAPRFDGSVEEWERALRLQASSVRHAQGVNAVADDQDGVECDCGAVPASRVTLSSCRRRSRTDENMAQDLVDFSKPVWTNIGIILLVVVVVAYQAVWFVLARVVAVAGAATGVW